MLDVLLLGCARRGAAAEVVLMLLVGLRDGRAGRGALFRCLGAVAGLYATCELIGGLAARRRPFAAGGQVAPLIAHAPDRSFPSRHVASATAMAILVRPVSRSVGALMALIAVGLGVGRVRAGLHYPSDVLAGAGLGYVAAAALRARTRG